MPEYKRIISYIYTYEEGERRENSGFVKAESRGGEYRITIQLKKNPQEQSAYKAYLYALRDGAMEGIFLGKLVPEGSSMVWKGKVSPEILGGLAVTLEDTSGIMIEGPKQKRYASQWKDAPVNVDSFHIYEEPAKVSEKPVLVPVVEEQNWENKDLFAGMPEQRSAEEQSIQKDSETWRELGKFSKKQTWEEEKVSDENTGIATEKSQVRDLEQENDTEQELPLGLGKSIVRQDTIANRNKVVEMPQRTTIFQATENQERAGTFRAAGKPKMVQISEKRTVPEKEAISGEKPIPEEEAISGEKPIPEERLILEEEAISGEKPIPEEEAISGEKPIPKEEAISDEKPVLEEEIVLEKELMPEEKPILEEEAIPKGETTLKREVIAEEEAIKLQVSAQSADGVQQNIKFQVSAQSADSVQQRDNPGERADSRQEKWEYLIRHFPVQQLFQSGRPPMACIRIGPRDLQRLPRGSWVLGNNSFLLHGYYQFRHLLLCRQEQEGTPIFYLGVPGIYNEKEEMMAELFGFEEFRRSRGPGNRNGNFGYWFRRIEEV
ncbi:MAG: hypothetical protein HFI33_05575 [Lachnospiraceae bacterium]|nr:hypothetical protein [Lachnospiraceae bacterium]